MIGWREVRREGGKVCLLSRIPPKKAVMPNDVLAFGGERDGERKETRNERESLEERD